MKYPLSGLMSSWERTKETLMNDIQPSAPMRAHRGLLVLVFGLISTPIWIFGAFSWILGNRDLKAMAEGKMDPGGKRLTRAGKILGITGLVLNLLWVAKKILIDGVGNVGAMPIH